MIGWRKKICRIGALSYLHYLPYINLQFLYNRAFPFQHLTPVHIDSRIWRTLWPTYYWVPNLLFPISLAYHHFGERMTLHEKSDNTKYIWRLTSCLWLTITNMQHSPTLLPALLLQIFLVSEHWHWAIPNNHTHRWRFRQALSHRGSSHFPGPTLWETSSP